MKLKKRILSFLLCAIMTITSIPVLPAYAADTVTIGSAAELPTELEAGKTYELTADITLSENQQISTLAGVLDGKGHTITLNGKPLANNVSGTIQNLGVKGNITISGSEGCIAAELSGTIQNCYSLVAATDSSWMDEFAGIAGVVKSGRILNCYFAGTSDNMMPGGMLVSASGECNVSNCCYTLGTLGSYGYSGAGSGNEKKSTEEMKQSGALDILNTNLPETGYQWTLPADGSNDGYPVLTVVSGDVNKDSLNATIIRAEALEAADYTEATWSVLETALSAAKTVSEDEEATQTEVNSALKTLEDAINGLEKIRPTEPVAIPTDESKKVYIKTQTDLEAIGSGAADKYYILDNDITLEYYFPSGTFNGVFDGNGHTITFGDYANGLFANIGEDGVVQNTHFAGALPNDKGACAVEVQGAIINCSSAVSGSEAYGFAKRLNGGVISNCYSTSTAKGAILGQTASGNGTTYAGILKNVYWKQGAKPVASQNNLSGLTCQGTVTALSSSVMQSQDFVDTMNANKGANGTKWGMSSDGYPYFGEDQEYIPEEDRLEANKTAIAFTPNSGTATTIDNQKLTIDRNTANEYKIVGNFSLPGYQIPAGANVTWGVSVADSDVMAINVETGEFFVYADGVGVVTATLNKADGSTEHLASVKVTTFTEEIEDIRLYLADDNGKNAVLIKNDAAQVDGSVYKKIVVKAKYKNGSIYQTISNQDFTFTVSDPEGVVKHMDNSSVFRFVKPGTATMTVAHGNGISKSVTLTSNYVAVTSVKPAHEGTFVLHGRNANSSGGASFNPIYSSIIVNPANASYSEDFTIESSDESVGEYVDSMVKGYVPYKAGTVTYTAKLNDNGTTVTGTSEVTYVYQNPLKSVTVADDKITVKNGEKVSAGLAFEGTKDSEGYEVTEAGMEWAFDKEGIVSISRNGGAFKRDESAPDNNCYFLSEEYTIKGLKEGTVKVTGTPVDQTAGAKAVTFTVTVEANSDLEEADIWEDISAGIANGNDYLSTDMVSGPEGLTHGYEWHVITLLRAGKNIDQDTLDQYYDSVVTEIKKWNGSEKPTEIERTALALAAMGKDITDVDGVNLAGMIYNSNHLTDGSNELAFALIALDANATEIPETARWSRAKMVEELLKYQNAENGGFGLSDNTTTGVDMTAMCIQALAPYKDQTEVAEAIEKALDYLRANITADYDYSDSCATAQVLLALAVLKIDVTDPANGFGNAYENIITRLYEYKTDDGFRWKLDSDSSKTAATYQVMQALDAYRKAMKEDISYWNFGVKGEDYEDKDDESQKPNDPSNPDNPENPENPDNPGEAAEPIDVYVTISNAGAVTVMQKSIAVADRNQDGYVDVDEVLYAAHEEFYEGGAAEGYATASTVYGLSITKLWGDTSGAFGYWKNNASCWSLGDMVEDGDYVNAFVYQDKTYYSDAYSYFESNTYNTVEGQAVNVLLKKADGYDEYWNTLFANYEGATIRVYKDGEVVDADLYTIIDKGDGVYEITFVEEGTYYLVATSETDILVPAVCEIVCAANTDDSENNPSEPPADKEDDNKPEDGNIDDEVDNKEDNKVDDKEDNKVDDKEDEVIDRNDKEESKTDDVKNDSAVNTGDSAPIMMLCILMAVALSLIHI